jgi:hypothetical protein
VEPEPEERGVRRDRGATALVAIAVVVFLLTRTHCDTFASEMIGLAQGLGLAAGLGLVYSYSKRIYDPALPFRWTSYTYSQSYSGGQPHTERRANGSTTSKVSRRGAILGTPKRGALRVSLTARRARRPRRT